MMIACPYCAAPAAFSAEPMSSSGRMMRCGRCGTSWLGRLYPDDPYLRPAVVRRGRPRFEQIIDYADLQASTARKGLGGAAGIHASAGANREGRIRTASRGWLAAWSGVGAAVVLAGLVTAMLLNAGGVDAATESGKGKFAGLEVRMLKGPEVLGDGKALAVTGEIVNRSVAALDVPAVRVALKAKGTELYSWTVEPEAVRLDPGGSIQFRSALVASPKGIDEVAFRLADRRKITVGMR
jgi:predicted Zn finger-like uncharacterized protein